MQRNPGAGRHSKGVLHLRVGSYIRAQSSILLQSRLKVLYSVLFADTVKLKLPNAFMLLAKLLLETHSVSLDGAHTKLLLLADAV